MSQHRELFAEDTLFCPGPTPTPWDVQAAALEKNIYHRSEPFYDLLRECHKLLKPLFGTTQDPVILTCSGTGGMESLVVTLTSPGDSCVVINAGKFGERWEKLCSTYGCKVTSAVAKDLGTCPTLADIENAIKKAAPRAIFFQAHETSTGIRLPIETIVPRLRALCPDALLIMDAISGLCAHPIHMDALGIDAIVAGSQKGFGVPPGLSFVVLSQRAHGRFSNRPRYYFDLAKEFKGQKEGKTAWTPAISLIQSLRVALHKIHATGVEDFVRHHSRLAAAARAACEAMGLKLFVTDPQCFSNALTAMEVPQGVDAQKILQTARKTYGVIIAGGQEELKGHIMRFSHLGFVSALTMLQGLAALEFALHDHGHPLQLGAGVQAAMRHLKR